MNHPLRFLSLVACAALAACGTQGDATPAAETAAAPAAETQAAPAATTGNVVEVTMVTDDKGNYFDPATVVAKQGDVIRFTLVSGVHNVSFPAEQNQGAAGLPAPSTYLQVAGQTVDVPVTMAAGEYNFQCDPHAALGMVGRLTVQ